VKIWEMRLAPGETGRCTATSAITSSSDRRRPDGGGAARDDEIAVQRVPRAEVVPGQYFYIPRGGVEVARNVGKQSYYELLIELKD
jgi:hypothetical protein